MTECTTPTPAEVRADRVRQGLPPTITGEALREFVAAIRKASERRAS